LKDIFFTILEMVGVFPFSAFTKNGLRYSVCDLLEIFILDQKLQQFKVQKADVVKIVKNVLNNELNN